MISTQPPKIIDDSSPSPSTSSTSTIFQQAIQNSSAYHRICAERRLEQPDPTHVAALSNLTHLTDLHANNLFNPAHSTIYQDMTRPIGDYFLYSSHNTYIAGNQLYGRSSLTSIENALVAGVRVIELDCMDGTGKYQNQIVVKHRFTPMTPILLSACLRVVQRCAFQTSQYPVILTIENHCGSHEQQRRQAHMLRDILGELLHIPSLNEQRASSFRSPESLKGLILLRHKYKVYDLHTSTPTREPSPPPPPPVRNAWFDDTRRSQLSRSKTSTDTHQSISQRVINKTIQIQEYKKERNTDIETDKTDNKDKDNNNKSTSPTPSSSPIRLTRPTRSIYSRRRGRKTSRRDTEQDQSPTTRNTPSPKTMSVQIARKKAIEIYETKIEHQNITTNNNGNENGNGTSIQGTTNGTTGSTFISKLPFGKKDRKSKKAIDQQLSHLVMISNQKVKVKTLNIALRSPFVFSCSWSENKMKRALASKKVLLKTMAFCQRHLMRVYPAYYRLDSSNFGPQKVWNAGVQMVALNTQTYGKHQAFNVAKFLDNGNCGYVLKPKWLRSDAIEKEEDKEDEADKEEEQEEQRDSREYSNREEINRNSNDGWGGDTYGAAIEDNTYESIPIKLNITPIACWLPHVITTSNEDTNDKSHRKRSNSPSLSSNSSNSSSSSSNTTNELEKEQEGVILHAVLVGADPHELTYRKIKYTTLPSKFHGRTTKTNSSNSNNSSNSSSSNSGSDSNSNNNPALSNTELTQTTPPLTTTKSLYAAWKWMSKETMSFSIFNRQKSGMELLHVSLSLKKKKKDIIGQFSMAVTNIRSGIRVVALVDQNGMPMEGGACLLLDIQFHTYKKNRGRSSTMGTEDSDDDIFDTEQSMKKVSSSNCLNLG